MSDPINPDAPEDEQICHYELTVGRPQSKSFMPTDIPHREVHNSIPDNITPLPNAQAGRMKEA